MSYINWKIKTQDSFQIKKLSSELGCSEIVSKLLINRGITDKKIAKNFLYPDASFLHDPFLLNDMNLASERIVKAIKSSESICIYGDYDVDGITSVSVLYLYLKNFTDNISYYIPDRFSQGYGINEIALGNIKKDGCDLIITVDTGVSAVNEIEFAVNLGMDVIVTDHHECQDVLPNALALINPKRHDSTYPFSKLAGVGVVYKLISALDIVMGTDFKDDYIDLVSIGTIADIMPLLDENRLIVKKGLEKIQKNPNPGLRALMDISVGNTNITSSSIGFAIAPRINAAGRLAKAETGVELFTCDQPEKAANIAKKLCDLNVERQKIENEIFEQASQIIDSHELDKKYNALVLWKEGWHSGVIGIVASKLKEKYNKPVVLFTVDDLSKGSGRSVPPFNLYAAFEELKGILVQFGGHKYAAGLLIENDKLFEFRDRLSELVGEYAKEHTMSNCIDVECEVEHKNITYRSAEEISILQPYGKSNEVPLFCIRNVKICEIFPTSNNKHIRLKLAVGEKQITGFYFGVSPTQFDYREGNFVDLICEINTNEYRNIKSVQVTVRDIRLTENQLSRNDSIRHFCDNFENVIKIMLPTRSEIGIVYKYFKKCFELGKNKFNLDTVANLINKDCLVNLNYEKTYFSIKVLLELGIVEGYFDDIILNITDIASDKRFSLADSELLMSIYQKAGVKFGN